MGPSYQSNPIQKAHKLTVWILKKKIDPIHEAHKLMVLPVTSTVTFRMVHIEIHYQIGYGPSLLGEHCSKISDILFKLQRKSHAMPQHFSLQ